MTIRKEGDKYVVRSQGGRKLGEHSTKQAAERQLAAVEANKRRRGKK